MLPLGMPFGGRIGFAAATRGDQKSLPYIGIQNRRPVLLVLGLGLVGRGFIPRREADTGEVRPAPRGNRFGFPSAEWGRVYGSSKVAEMEKAPDRSGAFSISATFEEP